MKKIIILTFAAIGMMPAIIIKAQSLSVSPYAGVSLDQQGAVSMNDPVVGITALAGLGKDIISLGIDMNGGLRYRYRNDTVWQSTNVPAILFVATLNLPQGEEGGNHFAGPIFGLAYGPGFPDKDHLPTGDFKLFLQGNYGGSVGHLGLGGFTQISFNYLGSLPVMYSWAVSVGFRVTIPHAFSGGGRE